MMLLRVWIGECRVRLFGENVGRPSAGKRYSLYLVSDGSRSFMHLRSLLKILEVEVWSAPTCWEAAPLVEQTQPELVFTAMELPDGPWNENVAAAENVPVPSSAIVVGKDEDIGLYPSIRDRGAFDFILRPFEEHVLDRVVQVAA